MPVAALNRTLDQELAALARGVSLECLVCGEFVLHGRGGVIACPECGLLLVRSWSRRHSCLRTGEPVDRLRAIASVAGPRRRAGGLRGRRRARPPSARRPRLLADAAVRPARGGNVPVRGLVRAHKETAPDDSEKYAPSRARSTSAPGPVRATVRARAPLPRLRDEQPARRARRAAVGRRAVTIVTARPVAASRSRDRAAARQAAPRPLPRRGRRPRRSARERPAALLGPRPAGHYSFAVDRAKAARRGPAALNRGLRTQAAERARRRCLETWIGGDGLPDVSTTRPPGAGARQPAGSSCRPGRFASPTS